jgi:cytochrome c553
MLHRIRPWLLAALVPIVVAATPPRQTLPTAPNAEGTPTPNLVAIHDPNSPSYTGNCLTCHEAVLRQTSKDPRVPHIHQEMIVYTPGFNPRHGVTNAVCVQCHRSTDVRDGSAAGLRVQVDRKICALCHGPSGPGKRLYE